MVDERREEFANIESVDFKKTRMQRVAFQIEIAAKTAFNMFSFSLGTDRIYMPSQHIFFSVVIDHCFLFMPKCLHFKFNSKFLTHESQFFSVTKNNFFTL